MLHPSVQVGGYQQWLLDNHSVFYETDAVALTAVSFLHNFNCEPDGCHVIWNGATRWNK